MWTYALKEIWHYRVFSGLAITLLAVGSAGFSAITSLKTSIQDEVRANSKAQSGADLVIQSRFQILPETRAKVFNVLSQKGISFEHGDVTEIFSMVRFGEHSRLVQLRAITKNLPFYGEMVPPRSALYHHEGWAYPELLSQFGAGVGDTLWFGDKPIKITQVVLKDQGAIFGRGMLAPRVYVTPEKLTELELIKKGSTVSYEILIKIPDQSVVAQDVATLIEKAIDDSTIRVRAHLEINEQNAKAVTLLGDYLGLMSIVAWLLCSIGLIYLVRSHNNERVEDYRTLLWLGFSRAHWNRIRFFTVFLLGTLGLGLTLCFGFLGQRLGIIALEEWNIPGISLAASSGGLWGGFLGGFGGLSWKALILTSFSIWGALAAASFASYRTPGLMLWVWIGVLLFLAYFQSSSGKMFLYFVGLLSVSLFGLYALWKGLKRTAQGLLRFPMLWWIKHALLSVTRLESRSLIAFLALGLGSILICLTIIADQSLKHEFETGSLAERPSLFLFDIQEEQFPKLESLARKMGHPLLNPSPMVRARLLSVRDEKFSDRDAARVYNLSSRARMTSSEKVAEGRYFSENGTTAVSEVSLEKGFAKRMGIGVGDKLEFDVLGVSLTGLVVGTRDVKWISFTPNFFIQFQPGSLDDFPKTYLAGIKADDSETRLKIQSQIVSQFPNVSILDVTRTMDQILKMSQSMENAVKTMAILVWLSGLFVVFAIYLFNATVDQETEGLLASMGVTSKALKAMAIFKSLCVGYGAVGSGLVISIGVSVPLMRLLFDRNPSLSVWIAIMLLTPIMPVLSILLSQRVKQTS